MSPVSWPPVLELVFDKEKVAVGLLMLFLWAVSKATECVWKQMRLDPTLGGRLSGERLRYGRLRRQQAACGITHLGVGIQVSGGGCPPTSLSSFCPG